MNLIQTSSFNINGWIDKNLKRKNRKINNYDTVNLIKISKKYEKNSMWALKFSREFMYESNIVMNKLQDFNWVKLLNNWKTPNVDPKIFNIKWHRIPIQQHSPFVDNLHSPYLYFILQKLKCSTHKTGLWLKRSNSQLLKHKNEHEKILISKMYYFWRRDGLSCTIKSWSFFLRFGFIQVFFSSL